MGQWQWQCTTETTLTLTRTYPQFDVLSLASRHAVTARSSNMGSQVDETAMFPKKQTMQSTAKLSPHAPILAGSGAVHTARHCGPPNCVYTKCVL